MKYKYRLNNNNPNLMTAIGNEGLDECFSLDDGGGGDGGGGEGGW